MKSQKQSKVIWLVAAILAPLGLVGCDSLDDEGENLVGEPVQVTSVAFSENSYWPSYGEDISSVGTQAFRVRLVGKQSGDYEILFRSEDIDATFSGMGSGDSYIHSWDGPSDDWSSLNGPVGSEQYFSETILLKNDRTDEEAEGLVVTRATIMPGGSVAFEVQEVISLP